ncbi:FAD-dependent oxidoreductase [Actinomadura sp. GTD37]|uniref:FAD-dependent oxidoreductase n=1 Tax=Actinomadura sp. GTD37 TaxID=1778030 RepID=UPI0035C18815
MNDPAGIEAKPVSVDGAAPLDGNRPVPIERHRVRRRAVAPPADLDLSADVLVIGGGPAGTWAALKAAEDGARVVLADKGYCGTSGPTASSGTGVWFVPPDPEAREKAVAHREALGGHLHDRRWAHRVLDQTYRSMIELGERGRYPWPSAPDGRIVRRGVHGPEYMRRQRIRVQQAGVRVLDHSPALELLVDADGAVAGAAGHRRQEDVTWRVRAGAVVLAAGGCAFLSRALGTNVVTGDGALFAAEVGAELSGMEFSNHYSIAAEFASVTKGRFFSQSTFFHEDGTVLEGAGSTRGRSVIGRTLLKEKVFCQLHWVDEATQRFMRNAQPNFFLPFDRRGIDPFTQRFPVTCLLEGSVRGTGGVRIVGDDCATSVPGLYAAGDSATRELVCGGFTGGGSHNAAWAVSSGTWAGRGAARHARAIGGDAGRRAVHATGEAGLRPTGAQGSPEQYKEVIELVQGEALPYEKNWFRTGARMTASLGALDDGWAELRSSLAAPGAEARRAREAAAMTAFARWMYSSALARTETRGMHKREDFPKLDPAQHHRLLTGGLDEIWVAPEPVRPFAVMAS